MGVDLAWIRSFLALAQTRNFAKAAAQTNVTQPAFSRRIRALEGEGGGEPQHEEREQSEPQAQSQIDASEHG